MNTHLLFVLLLFSHPLVSNSLRPMDCSTPGLWSFTISQSLPKFMFIALVMLYNHLILWHPLLLPSILPSIRVFSKKSSVHIRWPKYWSFSISPSNEYAGLISLKIDWFDLFTVQGTFRSLLQHQSSNSSIFFGILPFLWSTFHNHRWPLGRPQPWLHRVLLAE